MQSSRFLRRPAALLAAFAAALLSVSAPLAARADGDDTSGAGVARLSSLSGNVAIQRGDSTTPIAGVINAPVLGADYVTTGDDSRAEVQFDGSSAVRLGSNVQMRFTHIDGANRELQLAEGTIDLRLLHGTDGTSDVDTPSVTVRPLEAGSYRVGVDPSGTTFVTVRSGSASIITPQGNRTLERGSTLVAEGAASNPSITFSDAVALDDFDQFNNDLDTRELRALDSYAYVDRGVQGVDDLDQYGHWVSDPGYGQVWVPNDVASTWAPYRDGRWVWEDGYGWTWLGYEPWGWAPYHYGRWYHSAAYGWAWYPPRPAVVVTTWQPALVAFVGFGGGGGVSLSFGNVGWVPLAPYEPFHPWWGPHWNNNTTIVNNTTVVNNYYGNVNNGVQVTHYRNLLANGATYVSRSNFVAGHFEQHSVMTTTQLRSATSVQVARGPIPVLPTAANLRYTDHAVAPQLAARPVTMGERTFAGTAVVTKRTPFEQQRTTLATVTHVRLTPSGAQDRAAFTAPANTTPAATRNAAGTATSNAMPTRSANDPWSRFGTSRGTPMTGAVRPTTGMPGREPTTTARAARTVPANDAWSRFGNANPGAATRTYGAGRTLPTDTYSAPRRAPSDTYSAPRASAPSYSQPQQRRMPAQTYTPPRAYNPPPQRSYSPPQRSYSAPHYSPPAGGGGGGRAASSAGRAAPRATPHQRPPDKGNPH
ncbi:MAG: FecR domain-containing protein [Candidatus Eremiobacteraeota bacterium]|nr:FecR domain-containing protein [Candidatus Eremiobacteraeota bacterium]